MFAAVFLTNLLPGFADYPLYSQILLGDAIVCWRACVLWQGNRIVMGVCIVLLFTTFGMQFWH